MNINSAKITVTKFDTFADGIHIEYSKSILSIVMITSCHSMASKCDPDSFMQPVFNDIIMVYIEEWPAISG